MTVSFSEEPIDPAAIYRTLTGNDTGKVGSVLLHFAVVKVQKGEDGRTVGIEYSAKGDVLANLQAIAESLQEKWQLGDVALLRRAGKVGIGEIISLIAVNSPNSKDAFDACQFGIECLKKMPTIAKSEIYS